MINKLYYNDIKKALKPLLFIHVVVPRYSFRRLYFFKVSISKSCGKA